MKLIQLRYLVAVAENDLNITQAARVLHAAQPGVSKQLKQLEDELGFQLFERKGRALLRPTDAGNQGHRPRRADRAPGAQHQGAGGRTAQGRRGLACPSPPRTPRRATCCRRCSSVSATNIPKVRLHLHQGNSEQIADLAATDRIDFAIATGASPIFAGLVRLPCYRWHRCIIVPHGHPLGEISKPSFAELAQYPLVTYSFSFSGPSSLLELFAEEGTDAERRAHRLGFRRHQEVRPRGPRRRHHRQHRHRRHRGRRSQGARRRRICFPVHTTWAGFRRGVLLRGFMYDFLQMLAPHLTRAPGADGGKDRDAGGRRTANSPP